MKIKTYQSDARNYRFANYEHMGSYLKSDKVDNTEISLDNKHLEYKLIYETEYPEMDVYVLLHKIFEDFNLNHPKNFTGRSLSVSDILKINQDIYFCDSFGWKKPDYN